MYEMWKRHYFNIQTIRFVGIVYSVIPSCANPKYFIYVRKRGDYSVLLYLLQAK